MADSLSPEEIDDLINTSLGADEPGEDGVDGLDNSDYISTEKQKVFKPPKKDMSGMKFEYRSPVIKKENVVYNPSTDISNIHGKVIVRSLGNYNLYNRKKKNKF